MDKVKEEYNKRICEYSDEIAHLKKKSGWYVVAKLLSFLAFAYSLYAAYPTYSIIGISFIIVFIALYITVYRLDMKCVSSIEHLKRKKDVCLSEILYLDGNFASFRDGSEYIDISHQYSYDLDLFGPESLFNRINRTVSKRGERVLAHNLTNLPEEREIIEQNSEAVSELKEMTDWRIDFQSVPFIEENLKELSESMEGDKGKNWFFDSSFMYVSVTINFLLLFLGIIGVIPMNAFYAIFIFQLILSTVLSRRVSHYNMNAEKLRKEYRGYHSLLKKIYSHKFHSTRINTLRNELFNSSNSSKVAFMELSKLLNMFDQRNSEFSYIILNGLFLYDIYVTRCFNQWKKKYLQHVGTWIDAIAQFDSLVSLANYAYNNPSFVKATVIDGPDILQCKDIYHPFLWRKHPVANDFTLNRDNIAIVTGANMAGKSTFLRTIGINYIMASCGAPVAASSFKFSVISLFSSMRTTDNLSKDISYFNAELIRLRQLIEYVKSHKYTLIILDEILKGTNSKDKLEGSIMFLREISRYNVSGIIATHDLELSKLEQSDSGKFLNYCFEIELKDTISYSYKIGRGVSKNMNATFLLNNIIKEVNS